jgi:hypothetical protein
MPSARPRRSGEYAAVICASAVGIRIAAPTPWTARAAISQAMLVAAAQPTEAATNNTRPITNIRRRP